MQNSKIFPRIGGFLAGAALACGCASAPHAQLSAADSMDLLAASLAAAIEEYRADLGKLDDQRRRAVVDAFVARVRDDHEHVSALEAHSAAFAAALDRLEADRQTAADRRLAAMENIETLKEIAGELRRLAIRSMKLDDEASRYVEDLLSQVPLNTQAPSGEQNGPGK